ncbi:MAG: hypothetical protein ACOCWI_00945 [Bacillota bacterium]
MNIGVIFDVNQIRLKRITLIVGTALVIITMGESKKYTGLKSEDKTANKIARESDIEKLTSVLLKVEPTAVQNSGVTKIFPSLEKPLTGDGKSISRSIIFAITNHTKTNSPSDSKG